MSKQVIIDWSDHQPTLNNPMWQSDTGGHVMFNTMAQFLNAVAETAPECVSNTSVAEKIHTDMFNLGWWSDPKTGEKINRSMPHLAGLIASEVAEYMEAIGQNMGGDTDYIRDAHLPQYPNILVELVDGGIRILDAYGELEQRLGNKVPVFTYTNLAEQLVPADDDDYAPVILQTYLMYLIGKIADYGRKPVTEALVWVPMSLAFYMLQHLFKIVAYTLELDDLTWDEVMWAKHNYNLQREDHKLENRKKDGGKKY